MVSTVCHSAFDKRSRNVQLAVCQGSAEVDEVESKTLTLNKRMELVLRGMWFRGHRDGIRHAAKSTTNAVIRISYNVVHTTKTALTNLELPTAIAV